MAGKHGQAWSGVILAVGVLVVLALRKKVFPF